MSLYVDANVLVRLYLQLPGHRGILDQISVRSARAAWPLPVTDLLRFEVTNAIHRMVFESRSGGQWRVTPESAVLGLAEFSQHQEEGVFLRRSPLTLAEIELEYRRERQAAGIAVAKARGIYKGRRPGTTRAHPQRARELRMRGLAVAEIANALGVSERTAYRYLGIVSAA